MECRHLTPAKTAKMNHKTDAGINGIIHVLSTIPPYFSVQASLTVDSILWTYGMTTNFYIWGYFYGHCILGYFLFHLFGRTMEAPIGCSFGSLFPRPFLHILGDGRKLTVVPILLLYPPEIMPLRIRAERAGLSTATN